jgi:hypothetical protein
VKSKLASVVALGFLSLALSGGDCEPIDATNTGTDGGNGNGNGGAITTPEALLEAHEAAWNERDYVDYEALLDDEFEFYPLQEDANDFPWLEADSWGRTTELGMVNHMFDPNFTGGNGAVDLIEFDAVEQSRETLANGRIESTCTAHGRVMWTPTDGASFDTRLIFEFVERDGHLLIVKITEIPRTLRASGNASVEGSSFGSIKGLYR